MDGDSPIAVSCPACGRKLFDALGLGTKIRIICARCHALIEWPSLEAVIVSVAGGPVVRTRQTVPT